MQKVQYSFPQYRKYKDIDTWYMIIAEDQFEEVVKMGNKYIVHLIKATIFPEKLRIQDMLSCADGLWETVDAASYNRIREEAG